MQYEQTKAGPTEHDIAIAQAQVDQARVALAQARLRLEEGAEVVVSAPRRDIFEGRGGFIMRGP